jgi:hypothetical protein
MHEGVRLQRALDFFPQQKMLKERRKSVADLLGKIVAV